ncbi:hypothetical protein BXZ70DRAFT_93543 [Cristinia sonorae]|uniref:Uncharacterized protein n=1 Tax=Cristinia sonorae TaxID=1940300 RepID=A0A8K0UR06_9AGAR|nr:hypothetical protein BXZ70DRAFT_93543 [Cristinia sonorae]
MESYRRYDLVLDEAEDSPMFKVTGYSVLVTAVASAYTLYRLIVLIFGLHILPTLVEVYAVGVGAVALYLLGLLRYSSPPYRPDFFHEDRIADAIPFIRCLLVFIFAFTITLGLPLFIVFTALWTVGLQGFIARFITKYFLIALALWGILATGLLLLFNFIWIVLVSIFGGLVSSLYRFVTNRTNVRTLYNVIDSVSFLTAFGLAVSWLARTIIPGSMRFMGDIAPKWD